VDRDSDLVSRNCRALEGHGKVTYSPELCASSRAAAGACGDGAICWASSQGLLLAVQPTLASRRSVLSRCQVHHAATDEQMSVLARSFK
jgi:hypothetical protein